MSRVQKRERKDAFTAEKKRLALEDFSRNGRRVAAAKAAGVSPKTIDRHRQQDEDFGQAWNDAQEAYVEKLEEEAERRALEGTVVEKYDRAGKCISREVKASDGLLTLLLKANAPQKYAQRLDVKSENKTTVDKLDRVDFGSLTHEQKAALRVLLRDPQETLPVDRN